MTCELIVAMVTCVATVIGTVIAVLSFLKNKDEQKIKAALSLTTQAALNQICGDDQINFGLSFVPNITYSLCEVKLL